MLQRIQTIYLLLAVALCFACLCLPVGSLVANDNAETVAVMYNLWVSVMPNHEHVFAPWVLFVLLVIVTTGYATSTFLFKHRPVQARLTMLCCLLLIGWYAVYGFFIYSFCDRFEASFLPTPWAAFPAVACIAGYLAFRGIIRDEALVRSLDRLR